MTLTLAVSMLLGLFGIATMWMSQSHHTGQRKAAPIVGLLAQLAWGWYALLLGPAAGGLWILIALYTAVYLRGIWLHWEVRRWMWQRWGRPSAKRCIGCGRQLTAEEGEYYIVHCERCEGIAMEAAEKAA